MASNIDQSTKRTAGIIGGVILILMLAIGGYTIYWHTHANLFQDLVLDIQNMDDRITHVSIDYQDTAGYPFKIEQTLQGIEIRYQDDTVATIDTAVLTTTPFSANRADFAIDNLRITTRDVKNGTGIDAIIAGLSGQMAINVTQYSGSLQNLDITASDTRITTLERPAGQSPDSNSDDAIRPVGLITLDQHLLNITFPVELDNSDLAGTSIFFETDNVAITAAGVDEAPALTIPHFLTDITLVGRPDELTANALIDWTKDGGQVDITNIQADTSLISFEANGELNVDEQAQPSLTGEIALTGYDRTLNQLVAQEVINQQTADIIRRSLSLLSSTDENGQPEISVPVTIRKQIVFMGPIPIAKLPKMTWEKAMTDTSNDASSLTSQTNTQNLQQDDPIIEDDGKADKTDGTQQETKDNSNMANQTNLTQSTTKQAVPSETPPSETTPSEIKSAE